MAKNNVFVFIFILFVYGWMIYLKTLWLGQLNPIGEVVFLISAQSV